jgi:hypothetical protein
MADHEPIEQKLTNFYRQSRARLTGPLPSWDPRYETAGGSRSRQVIAAGAIAVFILAVAGGAYVVRQNQARGQALTNPSPPPSSTAGTPTTSLAVFAGSSPNDRSHYVVSLVRFDGHTVARATAARRTDPLGTPLPEVSTSATRVYYLDGDSQVRALTPDGKTVAVTKLAGNELAHVAFAVSPDDSRIAVSIIDYKSTPPTRRLYVSDLNGANLSELSVSGANYVWPVGWHAGNVVFAIGDAFPVTLRAAAPADVNLWCDPPIEQCPADNPYAASHGFYLVDPKDSTRLAALGSDQCQPISLMTKAGTLCREGNPPGGLITPTTECRPDLTYCLRLADWTGRLTDWTTLALVWIGALSPSARQMAACCSGNGIDLYEPRSAGGNVTRLSSGEAPLGWVDEYTLIHRSFASSAVHMFSLTSRVDAPVDAPGIPVAMLPGGF